MMNFFYSEKIEDITLPHPADSCLHLICLSGEGSLTYFDRLFQFRQGDLLVLSHPDAISNLVISPNCKGEFLAADYRFLKNLLPQTTTASAAASAFMETRSSR